MTAWMMPAAMLGGSALSGILGMVGANNANAQSNALAQQQMWQQQGFVNASRMDQYAFHDSNQNFQREMAQLGMHHAYEMAARNQGYNMDNFNYQFMANAALQREFAQNGIRWRMEDAARSGIHPVFAIGAGGAAGAPIHVGGASNAPASVQGMPTGAGPGAVGSPVGLPGFSNPMSGFAGLGQDLARAVHATQTPLERQSDQINFMELERHQWAREEHAMRMQTMGSRLALLKQPGSGPGMAGHEKGGAFGTTKVEPYETTAGATPASSSIGPAQPGTEWRMVGNGISAFPAQNLNIDEFSSPGYASWMIPNKLEPFFKRNPDMKPPEAVWKKAWPNATGIVHHFGIWYPTYEKPFDRFPAFDGLRNSPGPRPGVVKGMFIDRR